MAHQLRSCKTTLLKLGQGKIPTCSCHVRSQNSNVNQVESEVGASGLPHTIGQAPLSSRMSAFLMMTEKALPASLRPQSDSKMLGDERSRSLITEQVCKALVQYPWESYEMKSLYSVSNEHNGLPSHQSHSEDLKDSHATGPLSNLLDELKLIRSVVQPFSYTSDDIIIHEDTNTSTAVDFQESSCIKRKGSLDNYDTGIISRFKENVTVVQRVQTNLPDTIVVQHVYPTTSISHTTPCSVPNIQSTFVSKINNSAPLDSAKGIHCVLMSDSKGKVDPKASPVQSTTKRKPGKKPTEETLLLMKEHLTDSIPKIFRTHDYRIYINDVTFENNFWGPSVTSKGIQAYLFYIVKLRLAVHFKYVQTKVELLKITTHESDGTVRAHWRVQALPQMKILTNFWKFFPGRFRKVVTQESEIYEGISTFYLQGDGLVYKHRVDRVIEDEEQVVNKSGIALKMAVLIGLVPKTSIEELATLLYGENDFGIFPN
ncbi:unnamed protein product [Owenia fusiformis]|uniref:Uncharacterized protein n=1 Tax=Owenia fusiformis TaxID=6347 RepID=A0A8J1TYU5_OWEFU|nr:unnamed protein product [Owenia fusiformis]